MNFVCCIMAILAMTVPAVALAAPPALTTPSTTNVSAGMATLVLRSDGSGSGYFTLLEGQDAACGSGSQVKAGQDAGGAAAPYYGSLPLIADTDGLYTLRNLMQETAHTICFTAESPSGSNLNQTPLAANMTTGQGIPFTSPGWSMVGSAGFSPSTANFLSQAFAPDGTPYLAYVDANSGNAITVMSYSGGSWGVVGSSSFAHGSANAASLAFAPDGSPHISFVDADNGNAATVMKFGGSSWSSVGSSGFDADTMATSLAFAPDNTPYMAFIDAMTSGAKVIRYVGGGWEAVGSGAVSSGGADLVSMAISPAGVPLVAYSDFGGSGSGRVTVMKFAGGSWSSVGSTEFSTGMAGSLSLATASDGTPYVAYADVENGFSASVMNFGGSSWNLVGTSGFSPGGSDGVSLAIAPDGTPYVAFQDWENGYRATLMRYAGGSWSLVVGAGFSAGTASSASLAMAPDGTPSVAYADDANGARATVMKLVNLMPTIAGTPAATASLGVYYSFVPETTYADSFSLSGTLPPGLVFSSETGEVSGTPTAAGTYGNLVITASNALGSVSLDAFSITVSNSTVPDTTITSTPSDPDTPSFIFSFTSSEAGSTFECQLDGGSFVSCTSPYSGTIAHAACTNCRADAGATFAVRATNLSSNTDPTPASYSWTVIFPVATLCDSVQDGGVVQLPGTDFYGDLTISRSATFLLQGGFDSGYTANPGVSSIHGVLVISAGSVTVENIAIM